jgi:hypothetical protein
LALNLRDRRVRCLLGFGVSHRLSPRLGGREDLLGHLVARASRDEIEIAIPVEQSGREALIDQIVCVFLRHRLAASFGGRGVAHSGAMMASAGAGLRDRG